VSSSAIAGLFGCTRVLVASARGTFVYARIAPRPLVCLSRVRGHLDRVVESLTSLSPEEFASKVRRQLGYSVAKAGLSSRKQVSPGDCSVTAA